MKNIDLGKISVPMDQYASQGNAILGIRGSGKTYTGTYIAERLLDAGLPITVLDPIGMWRFLRVPGTGKGYPVVVAGGEHGDIPLPVHAAAEIARAAMRDGISIVFDLYDAALSKRQWRDIVEAVVKTMLYENKAHGLRHVFIEEAAEFVPQRIRPDQGAVYDVVERLARMGGNAQLGLTLINQRAEEVNKAVLDLCDLLVLHRQKGRNSLLNLGKWMDVASVTNAANVAKTVPGMENGEAFVWPAESGAPVLTKIPQKRSYHPDRRAMHKAVAAEAKRVDVGAFVETMKGSLDKLTKETEANDPRRLRMTIAALQRELAAKPPAGADRMAVENAHRNGFMLGKDSALQRFREIGPLLDAFVEGAGNIRSRVQAALTHSQRDVVAAPHQVQRHHPPVPQPRKALQMASTGPGDASLGNSGKRRMLIALAQNQNGLTYTKLSILTGISQSGGTWRTYLGDLRGHNLVDPGEPVRITQAGLKALGNYEPLPTGQALIDYWRSRLGRSGKRAIFDAVLAAYPRGVAQEDVSARTGISMAGGTWRTYLGELRGLELIVGRGELRASEELF